jgi:hypothetical protein
LWWPKYDHPTIFYLLKISWRLFLSIFID